MSLIKRCGHRTNKNHCGAMKNQITGLAEMCVFEEYKKLQKEFKNMDKAEVIKIIQANIMTLGLERNECLRRIEKTAFHETKKEEVESVVEQTNIIINKLNSKIFLLLGQSKKPHKNSSEKDAKTFATKI